MVVQTLRLMKYFVIFVVEVVFERHASMEALFWLHERPILAIVREQSLL